MRGILRVAITTGLCFLLIVAGPGVLPSWA
jgi:hypothetical protein